MAALVGRGPWVSALLAAGPRVPSPCSLGSAALIDRPGRSGGVGPFGPVAAARAGQAARIAVPADSSTPHERARSRFMSNASSPRAPVIGAHRGGGPALADVDEGRHQLATARQRRGGTSL